MKLRCKVACLVLAGLLAWAGSAAANTLTLNTYYGPLAANADSVMVSDDDGRWREVSGELGRYLVELDGPRFALAVTCFGAAGPQITLYRFLADELTELGHVCAGPGDVLSPTARFRGELRTPPADRAQLHWATVQLGALQLYSGVAHDLTSFSVSFVPRAAADIVALYGAVDRAPSTAVVLRGATVEHDRLVELDFAGEGALALQPFELSVPGASSAVASARLVTCGAASALVGSRLLGGDARLEWAALPEAARETCDRYELTAHQVTPGGAGLRLATTSLAEPADAELTLPEPVVAPLLDTVGTDPLRVRMSWAPVAGTQFYLGELSDGRVTWRFVQSAALAPAITLPPWGLGVGVPDLRGGVFGWGFGAASGSGSVGESLHAYGHNIVTGHGEHLGPVSADLRFRLFVTGGTWAPHTTELPGRR
ncbi:MAG: hypothetical protein WDA03_01735 [Trueperaceae bacterium]|jgi:hypothetical protein